MLEIQITRTYTLTIANERMIDQTIEYLVDRDPTENLRDALDVPNDGLHMANREDQPQICELLTYAIDAGDISHLGEVTDHQISSISFRAPITRIS